MDYRVPAAYVRLTYGRYGLIGFVTGMALMIASGAPMSSKMSNGMGAVAGAILVSSAPMYFAKALYRIDSEGIAAFQKGWPNRMSYLVRWRDGTKSCRVERWKNLPALQFSTGAANRAVFVAFEEAEFASVLKSLQEHGVDCW